MTSTIERPAPRRTRAPIDPRIQARRVEVQRDRGRRRLHRLVALGVVAGLVLAAVGATRSPLLDVDHIRVSGAKRTDRAALSRAAGVRLRRPLLDVDPGAIARRVEALPWVQRAIVRRSWPGTVMIQVSERRPLAVVTEAAGPVLVDRDGRV
ncbi:MAG: FtsQ-type protein, partial [Acidimicrobiales bacterium]|nr:FtsQ-type protein [Acidimicrobiales bacterium]